VWGCFLRQGFLHFCFSGGKNWRFSLIPFSGIQHESIPFLFYWVWSLSQCPTEKALQKH
jgi:hypothetical protein